jgi:hypothetical protein
MIQTVNKKITAGNAASALPLATTHTNSCPQLLAS